MSPEPSRRLGALAPRLHALGPRALAELLLDIAARTGAPDLVLARAERFAALSPAMIAAARADRFPPALAAVPDDRRAA